jgi:hypothetical protein
MPSSGISYYMGVVRIDVSEEHIASIIRMERIGEPGTTLAIIINCSTAPKTLKHRNTTFLRSVSVASQW